MRVLPHAAALSVATGAELQVLRVLEPTDLVQEPGEADSSAIERTRARITAELENVCQRHSVQATVLVEPTGKQEAPTEALLRLSQDAALLAMHSRGRSGLARLLQGSVALGVLKQTEQVIMLGGPELHDARPGSEGYRLLITSDLSPASEDILRALAPLLNAGSFQVTLVHIHEKLPAGQDNEPEVERKLAALNQQRALLPESTNVEVSVRQIARGGGVDTAILEAAREANAQAIAMSTHGHSAQRSLLMGSVALSVLGRSTRPLLVARA